MRRLWQRVMAGAFYRDCVRVAAALGVGWASLAVVNADELETAQQEFRKGNYSSCIRRCEAALKDHEPGESWRLLLAEAYVTVGRYAEAQTVITTALDRYSSSLRLRFLGYQIWQQSGQTNRAERLLDELVQTANSRPSAYRGGANLVVLGQAAMLRGADPKLVLERMFDQAKRAEPDCREAYLAAGDLALEKQDYELAAKSFRAGLERFKEDADFHFGLARAYAPNSAKELTQALQKALECNPNHIPSRLLLADHLIDAEEYAEAEKELSKVLAINPWQPEAWADRALLCRLKNDSPGETEARSKALHYWTTNPRVDYWIGQKLSRKYRFAEGAVFQRAALAMDSDFRPAAIQLAQDSLRLGEEETGWRLADEVYQSDGYNVVAFNLVTLKDDLAKFQTVTNQDFIVRMSLHEATIYGQRVLALLSRAKAKLSEKYGMTVKTPVLVEVFPDPKDFTVRTFGLPMDTSYLGVCFGRVITANSPASSTGHASNWEAMLWHEFTHVITLQMTGNKIPRWLSEGISVYEERQANPAWGQQMNAQYREMILGDAFRKLGNLSAAFMAPKDGMDLQFAYYESSLVVEFLIDRFGMDALKGILRELNKGTEIKSALAAHTLPFDRVEADFTAFARDRARRLAPELEWDKAPEKLFGDPGEVPEEWIRDHPKNFWALTAQGKKLLAAKQYEAAKAPLKRLIELYPATTDPDNAYRLLAAAHRSLNETNQERQVLEKFATLEAEATDAYLRLMELDESVKNWEGLRDNAARFLAVNPLVPQPYRYLARASEALEQTATAVEAYRNMLLLDPPNPAEVHFRLARLLRQQGDAGGAKRHVLQALEEAPRYRDAQRLLLEIEQASNETTAPPCEAPASAAKGS